MCNRVKDRIQEEQSLNIYSLATVQETGRFGVFFLDNTPETRMSVGGGGKTH